MTNKQALRKLWAMTDEDFTTFLNSLPSRVGLAVRGGLVKWVDVLPSWYIKSLN